MSIKSKISDRIAYMDSSFREYYYRVKAKEAEEKRKEEVRRVMASRDSGESFRANFEPDDDYNWDMFKNKD